MEKIREATGGRSSFFCPVYFPYSFGWQLNCNENVGREGRGVRINAEVIVPGAKISSHFHKVPLTAGAAVFGPPNTCSFIPPQAAVGGQRSRPDKSR